MKQVLTGFARSIGVTPLIVFAAVVIFATGCQLSTQEEPVTPPMKLGGATENCFGETLHTFEKYFSETATAEEIDTGYSCVSGALDLFITHARGSTNRESFSANELRTFLESQFLGSMKLSDPLLQEFMRIKQALLGGAIDRLTKTEITHMISVLETFRIETQRLRPYIGILSLSTSGQNVDSSLLEQALSDLNFSTLKIGALLADSKQPYKLDNLNTLLGEIQKLYQNGSTWRGPAWFAKQMPTIAAAKAVLILPQGDTIQPEEWRLLFSHIGRLYGLYLRFAYAIRDRDLFYGPALDQITIGVHQVVEVLQDAMAAKPSGKIETRLLKDFLWEVGKADTFKMPVQASTISGLLDPLLERIFNPAKLTKRRASVRRDRRGHRLAARGFHMAQGGLTTDNLARMSDTVLGWIEMQQQWELLEREAVRRKPALAGKPIPIAMVRSIWAGLTPQHTEPWSDLKVLIDRPLPPFIDDDGHMIIDPGTSFSVSRSSFASLNWKQQVIRTLGNGYLTDPVGQRMTGVTSDQFRSVFMDFWVLALDMKFLDPTDTDIWKTGFTISNMFFPSSNGDDRLGFQEAVDLFVFTWGADAISKKMIRVDVQANCSHGPLDPAGFPRIDEKCWKARFRKGYPKFFSTLPAWPKMVGNWNDGSWDAFLDDLERASRKATNPDGPLAGSEMDRTVSIHQFIEVLFARFDADQDGQLTMQESDQAFFLFKKLLKEASGFSDDSEVRALFFYLLAHGHPPETWLEKLKWLSWKGDPQAWQDGVHADRRMLTQIFGTLAASL